MPYGRRFCHRLPTSGFWLYNQQFAIVGQMVTFQPIFMSVEFATGGPLVVFVQDSSEQ